MFFWRTAKSDGATAWNSTRLLKLFLQLMTGAGVSCTLVRDEHPQPLLFLPFLSISYVTIDSFESSAKIAPSVASVGPGGGIGRRTWFRSMRRKVWRFESSLGHQHVVRSNPKKSEKPRKALCLRGFLSFAFQCGPVTSGVFAYWCISFGGNAKTGLKPCLLSAGKGLSLRIRPAHRPCYSDIVVLASGKKTS
jgi:hypothetical protein